MYSKLSVVVMCICFRESSGHYFFTVKCMLSLPHPQNYGYTNHKCRQWSPRQTGLREL